MDYQKLSKEISYALRHSPWKYELELDDLGWVNIEQLIYSLKQSNNWNNLTQDDLIIMLEKSDKKRHEFLNGKIRALYGHSIPKKISKEEKMPPKILFHGTARRYLDNIKNHGLLPQSRQYVHLSVDTDTAFQVGKRRDEKPILLKICSLEAWHDGLNFYIGNDKVWLANNVPSKYIEYDF